MRVAVAGGTGVVGRFVVSSLQEAGHEPVVLARSRGVDLTTGAGLSEAIAGAAAVVDVSNVATMSAATSVAFFEAVTSRLLSAGAAAGVRHHVVLSIVGSDTVDFPYYQGKRRQEELVRAGSVPATVLRTTQFHEFAGQVLARSRAGVALVPRMRIAPVAASEVAQALVAIAVDEPVGRAPDLGGPEVHELPDLARRLVRARGGRTRVVQVRIPGAVGRQLASGSLLPGESARRGTQTFAAWLAAS